MATKQAENMATTKKDDGEIPESELERLRNEFDEIWVIGKGHNQVAFRRADHQA
jgi:hypothetical protein